MFESCYPDLMQSSPFWTWPTTGALIAALASYCICKNTLATQATIKIKDALASVREAVYFFKRGLSLALVMDKPFGERFIDGVGGWDGFCDVLNKAECQIDIFCLYAFEREKIAAEGLRQTLRQIYTRTHNASVDSVTFRGELSEERRQSICKDLVADYGLKEITLAYNKLLESVSYRDSMNA